MADKKRNSVKGNDPKKKSKKSFEDVIKKIDEVAVRFEKILLAVALVCTGFLDVIFIRIPLHNIEKYILVFYLTALCLLIFGLLCNNIFKNNKFIPNYGDNTWLSYIIYVIILAPVVLIMIYAGIINKWESTMKAQDLLQIMYWSIAGANFIWFLSHMRFSKEHEQRKKINLQLKLMVVIISGVGLIMDIVAQINFTKQFLFIAWTVLVMSYISDSKAD